MSPRARRPPQPDPATPPASAAGQASGLPASTNQPRLARIAERAYAIYERRGGRDGSSVEDWLQAEREIDSEP